MVVQAVDAERVERGDDDEDGRPAVVEREGEVDKELVAPRLGDVVLLHNVVNVLWGSIYLAAFWGRVEWTYGHCGADEEGEHEGWVGSERKKGVASSRYIPMM